MSGINKVILIGNLGADPEIRHLENGQTSANVRLATNRNYVTKEGEKKEETEWHRIVFWGRLAEIVEKYLRKGSKIYVEGRLRTRQWEDKDGNTKYMTEIVSENMTMLSSRRDDEMYSSHSSTDKEDTAIASEEQADDLPF